MIEFRAAAVGAPEFPPELLVESLPVLVGASGPMNRLRAKVLHAAVGEGFALVLGEPGSGKSLVARALHEQGLRAPRACVVVPCHALPERLLEVELFGSASDATCRRHGIIESTAGGTVILENIELLGGRIRALLERFLETGCLHHVGSLGAGPPVDTRIIATSSRFGRYQRGSHGGSEAAWWERFAITTVHVPTLRERTSDIPLLLHRFVATAVARRELTFSQDALAALESYSWPGNVSQLRSVVERLVAGAVGTEIHSKDLPVGIRPRRAGFQMQRPSVGEELFSRIQATGESFWSSVYPLFMKREITRTDLRDLMRRALQRARGNAEELVRILNMPDSDRQKFARFLRKYDCEFHTKS
ncbi:MAG TPA: sigma 54-interacting transcriptional regulator [Vicinamibacterales bacterium]|nr:sigma 54-interacting transcriptional regulator [Vicinamibacterales bacterium]